MSDIIWSLHKPVQKNTNYQIRCHTTSNIFMMLRITIQQEKNHLSDAVFYPRQHHKAGIVLLLVPQASKKNDDLMLWRLWL